MSGPWAGNNWAPSRRFLTGNGSSGHADVRNAHIVTAVQTYKIIGPRLGARNILPSKVPLCSCRSVSLSFVALQPVVLDADLLPQVLLSLSHGSCKQDRFLVDSARQVPQLEYMYSRCVGASPSLVEAETDRPQQSPASSARSREQSA